MAHTRIKADERHISQHSFGFLTVRVLLLVFDYISVGNVFLWRAECAGITLPILNRIFTSSGETMCCEIRQHVSAI